MTAHPQHETGRRGLRFLPLGGRLRRRLHLAEAVVAHLALDRVHGQAQHRVVQAGSGRVVGFEHPAHGQGGDPLDQAVAARGHHLLVLRQPLDHQGVVLTGQAETRQVDARHLVRGQPKHGRVDPAVRVQFLVAAGEFDRKNILVALGPQVDPAQPGRTAEKHPAQVLAGAAQGQPPLEPVRSHLEAAGRLHGGRLGPGALQAGHPLDQGLHPGGVRREIRQPGQDPALTRLLQDKRCARAVFQQQFVHRCRVHSQHRALNRPGLVSGDAQVGPCRQPQLHGEQQRTDRDQPVHASTSPATSCRSRRRVRASTSRCAPQTTSSPAAAKP